MLNAGMYTVVYIYILAHLIVAIAHEFKVHFHLQFTDEETHGAENGKANILP